VWQDRASSASASLAGSCAVDQVFAAASGDTRSWILP
jgi:hypothetical protein